MTFNHQHNSDQNYFLRIWKAGLHSLLNWDDSRVEKWVAQSHPDVHDPNSWTNHETPTYWLIELIMPERLYSSSRLRWELEELILSGNRAVEQITLNWEEICPKVDAWLQQHGESLASVKRELDERGEGLH